MWKRKLMSDCDCNAKQAEGVKRQMMKKRDERDASDSKWVRGLRVL
jgi:hypothetical protein